MPKETGGGSTEVALADVRTPEQFVAAMRQRKARSGLTYLELARRADAVGDELSPDAALVDVDGMPSERLVAAFVRACGDSPDEVAAWVSAHRRIAAAADVPAADPPGQRPANPAWTWLADLLPPIFVHARRPVRVAAVAVSALLLVAVAAVWVTSGPLEEYGVFPIAAPEDEADDDEPADPTPSPEFAVRKGTSPSPGKRPPSATPTPTPTETLPDDEYPYPPPGDGSERYPSPTDGGPPPTEDWPDDGGGGTYCEPYPSPVCRHG